jgi:hypothetical protein
MYFVSNVAGLSINYEIARNNCVFEMQGFVVLSVGLCDAQGCVAPQRYFLWSLCALVRPDDPSLGQDQSPCWSETIRISILMQKPMAINTIVCTVVVRGRRSKLQLPKWSSRFKIALQHGRYESYGL